jgi:dTDP-4-dehydrorhamnose reductase
VTIKTEKSHYHHGYVCCIGSRSKNCSSSIEARGMMERLKQRIETIAEITKDSKEKEKLEWNSRRGAIYIKCTAMTNVHQCEIELNAANNVNHLSVKELVNYIANNKKCFLLYISTDYVFNGEKGNYVEADEGYDFTRSYFGCVLERCTNRSYFNRIA